LVTLLDRVTNTRILKAMPAYFPENNTPLTNDSQDRLVQKLVSLANTWAGSIPDNEPKPNDTTSQLYQKLVKSLTTKAYA